MSWELNGRTTFVFQMLFFWVASRALKGIFLIDKQFSATDGAFNSSKSKMDNNP